MNLFPPFFMYFPITAYELIRGNYTGIYNMQLLIVVEGDIRINDYRIYDPDQLKLWFSCILSKSYHESVSFSRYFVNNMFR